MLERYGTTKMAHIEGVQERRSETLTKTHAARSPEEKQAIQDKRSATQLKRYGVENISQSQPHREKVIASNLEHFGVEHSLQDAGVRAKGKETMVERYGADHPAHVPEIIERKKATMVERWGVEYPYQSEEIRDRFAETMRERWGKSHPMHVPELFEKQQTAGHKWKEFTLPSGMIVLVQGYEPEALNYLFSRGYNESDFQFFEKPTIEYLDDFTYSRPKHRLYYPDLWLPARNHLVEVKSEFTLADRRLSKISRNPMS